MTKSICLNKIILSYTHY